MHANLTKGRTMIIMHARDRHHHPPTKEYVSRSIYRYIAHILFNVMSACPCLYAAVVYHLSLRRTLHPHATNGRRGRRTETIRNQNQFYLSARHITKRSNIHAHPRQTMYQLSKTNRKGANLNRLSYWHRQR